MTTLLLDTHVVHWLAAEPERLSSKASNAIAAASELAVAGITWFELAWLAHHGRIATAMPVRTWLTSLAEDVVTLPNTPAISDTAVALPAGFPGDPADRLIYATAIEHGMQLVSKDQRLRTHVFPRPVVIW